MKRRFLSIGISLLALGWVAWEVTQHAVWAVEWPDPRWPAAGVVIALMPVNWGVEVAKWRFLNPGLAGRAAIKEVLVGAAWAFATPNRVGEVAGRVAVSRREGAARAFATSGAAQLFVTVAVGGAVLAMEGPAWAIALGLAAALGAYLAWSPRLPDRWGWVGATPVPMGARLGALGLSSVRYAVFTGQYVLAFAAVGIEVPVRAVPLIFLGNALVPSAALGELGVREAVTLAVLQPEGAAVGAAVVATFGVWFVNLAVPAAVGAVVNARLT
jgi:hypothetical protein